MLSITTLPGGGKVIIRKYSDEEKKQRKREKKNKGETEKKQTNDPKRAPPQPFSVCFFLVHGYARRAHRDYFVQIPSDIKHLIFGYYYCPDISRYVLERQIDDSHIIDHQSLHQIICDRLVADFNDGILKDEEHFDSVITRIMTSCGDIVLKNSENKNEESPLFDSTITFFISILASIQTDTFDSEWNVAVQFINELSDIHQELILRIPKPKELLEEHESFGIVSERIHMLLQNIAATPRLLNEITYRIIVDQSEGMMYMIGMANSYGDRAHQQIECIRKLAWATGVVAERLGNRHRDGLVSIMSQRLIACRTIDSVTKADEKDVFCDMIYIFRKCPSMLRENPEFINMVICKIVEAIRSARYIDKRHFLIASLEEILRDDAILMICRKNKEFVSKIKTIEECLDMKAMETLSEVFVKLFQYEDISGI